MHLREVFDYPLSRVDPCAAHSDPPVIAVYETLVNPLDHDPKVTFRRGFGWIQEDDGESSSPDVITVEEKDEESEFVKVRKRNWARLIARVWKDDPEVCPECGSKLEVLSAISSPAQDDVIERILRCRGEWCPPWERERPPKQLEMFSEQGSGVPIWNPEDENQDPPGDAWME